MGNFKSTNPIAAGFFENYICTILNLLYNYLVVHGSRDVSHSENLLVVHIRLDPLFWRLLVHFAVLVQQALGYHLLFDGSLGSLTPLSGVCVTLHYHPLQLCHNAVIT